MWTRWWNAPSRWGPTWSWSPTTPFGGPPDQGPLRPLLVLLQQVQGRARRASGVHEQPRRRGESGKGGVSIPCLSFSCSLSAGMRTRDRATKIRMVFPLHSPPPFSYPFDCSFSANSTPFRLTFSSLPHVVVAVRPSKKRMKSSPPSMELLPEHKPQRATARTCGNQTFHPCVYSCGWQDRWHRARYRQVLGAPRLIVFHSHAFRGEEKRKGIGLLRDETRKGVTRCYFALSALSN